MPKFNARKITPKKAASWKVKTGAIAAQRGNMPKTRNDDGSIKPRRLPGAKGGTKTPSHETKPQVNATNQGSDAPTAPVDATSTPKDAAPTSNGHHPVTLQQVASSGQETKEPAKPEQVEVAPATAVVIPMKYIMAALAIAPKADNRPNLNGVHIHAYEGEVRAVATDGHRLIVTQLEGKDALTLNPWLAKGVTIPQPELARIAKYIGGRDESAMEIVYGDNQQHVIVKEFGGIATFQVTPIDGQFPDYQRVLDKAAATMGNDGEGEAPTVGTDYLKSASVIASKLQAQSITSFVGEPTDPVVFTFVGAPLAILCIMQQRVTQAIQAPTLKMIGRASVEDQIAKLRQQIAVSEENAKRTKHEHCAKQSLDRIARLQLRIDQLEEGIGKRLEAPKPQPTAPVQEARVTH